MLFKCTVRSLPIVARSRLGLNARRLSTLDEILSMRNLAALTPAMEKELELYSKKKQTSVSLRSLMDTGRGENSHIPAPKSCTTSDKVLMQVACFLHRELPIRLAHRATRLEASPLFAMSGKRVLFYVNSFIITYTFLMLSLNSKYSQCEQLVQDLLCAVARMSCSSEHRK